VCKLVCLDEVVGNFVVCLFMYYDYCFAFIGLCYYLFVLFWVFFLRRCLIVFAVAS
jgi:hypothetical protein